MDAHEAVKFLRFELAGAASFRLMRGEPIGWRKDYWDALDFAVAALERETYMRDVEVKRRDNHISDCACDICIRVMRYEDALHAKIDDQRCGSCNDIHDTLTPCNNDHEDDAA